MQLLTGHANIPLHCYACVCVCVCVHGALSLTLMRSSKWDGIIYSCLCCSYFSSASRGRRRIKKKNSRRSNFRRITAAELGRRSISISLRHVESSRAPLVGGGATPAHIPPRPPHTHQSICLLSEFVICSPPPAVSAWPVVC